MSKVAQSVRNLYLSLEPNYGRLKTRVQGLLKPQLQQCWHFEDRIKTMDSYALKLETGRVGDLTALEDFYACTIVVRNHSEIQTAKKLIIDLFEYDYERPNDNAKKRSHEFPFDDLRVYVKWKDNSSLPPSLINGTLFEIQIKTYLQHAWSIATHDLIYKSDEANWGKERIAFHVKAMLEHAELSISEAGNLSSSDLLSCRDDNVYQILKILESIKKYWVINDLPSDAKRLSNTLNEMFKSLKVDYKSFSDRLDEFREITPWPVSNISIYSNFLYALIELEPGVLKKYLSAPSVGNKKPKILVVPEIELPKGWDLNSLPMAIQIPTPKS